VTSTTSDVPWIRIRDAASHVGQVVEVRGWITHKRSSGKVQFVVLRDGSGLMQCVAGRNDVTPEDWESLERLGQEAAITVQGSLRADARSPGGVELGLRSVRLVGPAESYPITPKEHGTDFLMDHRHLWLRSPRQQALMRLRAEVISSFRDFMDGEGFTLVDAPIFTPSACEGTTTLFEVQYFDQQAFLTQSGQLYMEAAAMALGRVYCFGPAFRAEKSKTRRHLIEFWMMEPEWAFATLDDVIETAEGAAEYLHRRIREEWGFADPADMTMQQRFTSRYRGKRYSFGYPACPNLDDQQGLWKLLQPEEIGVHLTEGMMMEPEASVSALVFHHPDCSYFTASAVEEPAAVG